jgi:subtilase family serine protease
MGAEQGRRRLASPRLVAGLVGLRDLLLLAAVVVLSTAVVGAAPAYGSSGGNGTQYTPVGEPGHPPPGSTDEGPAASSQQIHVSVTLESQNPAGLSSYASGVSTPGNADYHHYLTVSQFAARFGASAQDVASVRDWLTGAGLRPGPTSPNDLAVPISASIGDIERAFKISIHQHREPSGRTAYANTQAPQVPTDVAGHVQAIVGLDDLYLRQAGPGPESAAGTLTSGGTSPAGPLATTTGPTWNSACGTPNSNIVWTASQLATAYSMPTLYGQGLFGSGVTVGLFELEQYSSSDISSYENCYNFNGGYPHPTIANITVDGGPGGLSYGSGEAALDIEDVVGLAPQANIDVYEGPNTDSGLIDTYNAMVSQDKVQVISTSWGLCEPDTTLALAQSENTIFEEAATQGQSVFSAAGDDGSSDCSANGTLAVDDPASQPYVTGVGGTDLTALAPTETVWNGGCSSACAGGGGVSTFWNMPSWQQGTGVINSNSSGAPCGASSGDCREVPDVTASADPSNGYLIYYKHGWIGIGGTSGAAPLWASVIALVDSGCASVPVGFVNPRLYQVAADMHDITSGNNQISSSVPTDDYTATTGYDLASGLGSPNAANLFSNVCAPVVESITPNAGPTAGGTTVTVTGASFQPNTTVYFGTDQSTSVVISSSGRLTAVSPPESSGTIDITISTRYGTSIASPADQFTYVSPPTVTGVSPMLGPAPSPASNGENSVTISGTNFVSGSTTVSFGTASATNVTVSSPNQLTAISPPESAGTVPVTVTTPGGTSATTSASQFTYCATFPWPSLPTPPGRATCRPMLSMAILPATGNR